MFSYLSIRQDKNMQEAGPHPLVFSYASYDFPAFSMQFHPEFSREYMSRGIELLLGRAIEPDLADQALQSMASVDVAADLMAERAAATLRSARRRP